MHEHQFKELWEIRFLNILNLEKESSVFYMRLLRRNKMLLEDSNIRILLEQIMNDRAKRTRIAHQLVNLVRAKEISEEVQS